MSTAPATERVIYVRLLNEGTEVSRPTKALDLGGGVFAVLATPNYDPEDGVREFPPGTRVQCEKTENSEEAYLRAVRLYKEQ